MAIPKIQDYPMPSAETFPENRVSWKPEAARSVLLIHDMQRYFLDFYGDDSVLKNQLIETVVKLRAWAKENGIPVVYTQQPHEQSKTDRALLTDFWGPGLSVVDADLQKITEALSPDENDIILDKHRYSAFQRSDFKEKMKSWGRDQLLICGVYAHIGCLVTATDAFMNDIQTFMVGDALADFSMDEHKMALSYVATRCGCVIDSNSLLNPGASAPTRDWLETQVLNLIEDDEDFDADENLIYFGLDSLRVMRLANELKKRGVTLSFEELARKPTLNGWWSLIEGKIGK